MLDGTQRRGWHIEETSDASDGATPENMGTGYIIFKGYLGGGGIGR